MTRERPIMFTGPMVRAILEGRKTQTRRIVKRGQSDRRLYSPGDHLWVREAWRYHDFTEDGEPWIEYRAGSVGDINLCDDVPSEWADRVNDVWAELSRPQIIKAAGGYVMDRHWRPSIYMPRWASRITLLVTDVRLQRVQDITEADALAEGCAGCLGPHPDFPDEWDPAPEEEFQELWNSIHGPDAWERNDWVAAITFRRLTEKETK